MTERMKIRKSVMIRTCYHWCIHCKTVFNYENQNRKYLILEARLLVIDAITQERQEEEI